MAVLYFTSNADSGDGTLRSAIANANDGDIITYDPAVFTTGPIIIAVSSALITANKNLTIDGGELGIVLDGQQTNITCISLTTGISTITLQNFTIKRFNRTQNGPIYLNGSDNVLNLHRCKIVDNQNNYFGAIYILNGTVNLYDSLVCGNNSKQNYSTYAGGIRLGAGGYLNLIRSTVVFNTIANVYGGTERQTITDSFVGFDSYSELGDIEYVNPPEEAYIPFGDWEEGLWQNYDFRLKPTSPYLTGAAYNPGDLDLLGNARTGSWGCYDGSWLVSPFSVSQDITVDYADIQGAGTIADGAVVKVGKLYAAGGSVSASGRAYFCADTLAGLTFTNVVAATPSGVSAIAASIAENVATVDVTATGTGYVVEISDDLQSWTTLSLNNGKATLSNSNALYFRVFDGGFLRSEIVPRYYYYQGTASGGSFATASDWSLDKAGAIALSSKPTISGCYFDCRK